MQQLRIGECPLVVDGSAQGAIPRARPVHRVLARARSVQRVLPPQALVHVGPRHAARLLEARVALQIQVDGRRRLVVEHDAVRLHGALGRRPAVLREANLIQHGAALLSMTQAAEDDEEKEQGTGADDHDSDDHRNLPRDVGERDGLPRCCGGGGGCVWVHLAVRAFVWTDALAVLQRGVGEVDGRTHATVLTALRRTGPGV